MCYTYNIITYNTAQISILRRFNCVYFSFQNVQYVPGSTDRYRNDRLGNKKYEFKENISNSERASESSLLLLLEVFIILFSSFKAADIYTVRVLTAAPAVPMYCAAGRFSRITATL